MIHEKIESVEIGIGHSDDAEIFRTLESICEEFPSKYWRDLEDAPVTQRYPAAFVTALEQAGFLGAGVPEDHGGIGLPMGALARIIETIHAGGCNADTIAEQFALSLLIVRHGSDAMRSAILTRIPEGAKLQTLAIWESASGQDTKRIRTAATRRDGGFALNGRKRWARFADTSDLMLVVARTGESPDNLSVFLVDLAANRGQLSVTPIEAMKIMAGRK
jgi:acyl-CoA dehydrogenase